MARADRSVRHNEQESRAMLYREDSPHTTERDGWTFVATLVDDEIGAEIAYDPADTDMRRKLESGDAMFVAVVVTASRHGIELGSASLWGIYYETPSDDMRAFLDDTERDLIADATRDGMANLRALCDDMPAPDAYDGPNGQRLERMTLADGSAGWRHYGCTGDVAGEYPDDSSPVDRMRSDPTAWRPRYDA